MHLAVKRATWFAAATLGLSLALSGGAVAAPSSIRRDTGTDEQFWMEAGDPTGPPSNSGPGTMRFLGVKPSCLTTTAGRPIQPEPDS